MKEPTKENLEALLILLIALAIIFAAWWYRYLHSFHYTINQFVKTCIRTEHKSRNACMQEALESSIEICHDFTPDKTDQECRNTFWSDYQSY